MEEWFQDDEFGFRARIYRVVEQIPEGKVATYGQVASLAGYARAARACGQVLRSYVGGDLPWHRVINAQGRISGGGDLHRPALQQSLLEAEGVVFRRSGRCDLGTYLWGGPQDLMPWE